MLVCNFMYACMLGCMYVCEGAGSFAGGCPSLADIHSKEHEKRTLRQNISHAIYHISYLLQVHFSLTTLVLPTTSTSAIGPNIKEQKGTSRTDKTTCKKKLAPLNLL